MFLQLAVGVIKIKPTQLRITDDKVWVRVRFCAVVERLILVLKTD
jgi:hypothetical protein